MRASEASKAEVTSAPIRRRVLRSIGPKSPSEGSTTGGHRSRDTAQAWGCWFLVSTPEFDARLRAPDGSLLGPRVGANAQAQCERKTRFDLAVLRLYRARPGQKDEVVAVDRRPALGATEYWIWELEVVTPCREGWSGDDPPLYARAVFTKRGKSERIFVASPVWDAERDRTCPDHGSSDASVSTQRP